MIAWMLYTVIVGCCAVVAAAAAEWLLRVQRRPIRFVWIVAAGLSMALAASAPLRTRLATHSTTPQLEPASLVLVQTSLHSVERRVPPSVLPWMVALWGLSTLLVALSFLTVYRRVRRARLSWPVVELLDQRVRISPTIGPLVMGLVRPEIIVPRWVLDRTREEQRLILAHEAAHLRARDPILLGTACALVALMPWNPALWIILSRVRLAIEVDCDTRVLRGGVSARSYSSLLVDVAEHAMPLRLAATALTDHSSHLRQRILAMQPRRFSHPLLRGLSAALLGIVALLAACEAKMPTAAQIDQMDARSAESSARQFGLVSDTAITWFVNGVRVSGVEAKKIAEDSIAQVEINKVEGHPRIYVTTKGAAKVGYVTRLDTARALRRRLGKLDDTLAAVIKAEPVGVGAEPMLLLDGQRADLSVLKTLDRTQILTVNVVKGASATEMYGPDAKNGVVIVRTKQPGAQ